MRTIAAKKLLSDERARWRKKPALRTIYSALYKQMLSNCVRGRAIEIGSGSGNLKLFAPKIITTDIVEVPWVDIVTDAMHLPFAPNTLSNLLGFDVLHHLEYPRKFFLEATRVVKPGGRVILCEPVITPLSNFFYKYGHSEPVDLTADPFECGEHNACRDPFDANQALPTLLFIRKKEQFQEMFPTLFIKNVQLMSLFAYPLSGGFRGWSLLPRKIIPTLLRLETTLLPIIGKFMAFRMLIVVERR